MDLRPKSKLSSVSPVDRGNYTCRPATGGEASISLYVIEGDQKDDDDGGDDDDDDHDDDDDDDDHIL